MPATPSLRNRKRQETHERLEQTALRLFAERGFDSVTVEEICREAGVGPATFYRHFGAKEEVVFAYRAGFARALAAGVESARREDPGREAMSRILAGFASYLESQQDLLALRDSIVLRHEGLMRRTISVQREFEAQLAAGLADLRGLPEPDESVLAEAAVGVVVLRLAVRSWRAGRSGSLPAATSAAFAQVRKAISS